MMSSSKMYVCRRCHANFKTGTAKPDARLPGLGKCKQVPGRRDGRNRRLNEAPGGGYAATAERVCSGRLGAARRWPERNDDASTPAVASQQASIVEWLRIASCALLIA